MTSGALLAGDGARWLDGGVLHADAHDVGAGVDDEVCLDVAGEHLGHVRNRLAQALLERDPELTEPGNRRLRAQCERLFEINAGRLN